ncbi:MULTISPECIES: STAS domain-containing protein [Rossellomorea]|uniref:STAS domain-containing protein n=1 Tax=Rossellomorea TaxID=2837508 RepID=UPI001CCF50C8|nr:MULTISPECIES: STAS domain-containing protein [Rossellomorea]MCA0149456.1 STAS domain-containing protein [Rossellomorea vietnamensis]WGG46737.1 STAS domain-containing protein [Rossellomorea sp. DA94]
MQVSEKFYTFMSERTWQLTENWYESLDKSDPTGVYASRDLKVIQTLKEQNHAFHERFCNLFKDVDQDTLCNFEQWIEEIAKDEEHLQTPTHFILREFFRTQDQYLDILKEFIRMYGNEYSLDELESLRNIIIKTFSLVISKFAEENYEYSQRRLNAQQEMIRELSSPVILLNKKTGVLPLIGDIDTGRARYILENTLAECVDKNVEHLFIDLSGVIMVDTMVAHQLFQIIESLNLIGVKSTISGIRPEIAQTAIQLGISFENISVTSTLERALNEQV